MTTKTILILNYIGLCLMLFGCIRLMFVCDQIDDNSGVSIIGFGASLMATLFTFGSILFNSILFFHDSKDENSNKMNQLGAYLILIIGVIIPSLYLLIICSAT